MPNFGRCASGREEAGRAGLTAGRAASPAPPAAPTPPAPGSPGAPRAERPRGAAAARNKVKTAAVAHLPAVCHVSSGLGVLSETLAGWGEPEVRGGTRRWVFGELFLSLPTSSHPFPLLALCLSRTR